LKAELIQLQDRSPYSLADAKKALKDAVALDSDSPAGRIEPGHFLDAMEDDPKEAARAFSSAAAQARRSLIEALLARASALVQLERQEEARNCLLEALSLMAHDDSTKNGRSKGARDADLLGSDAGRVEELLQQVSGET